MIKQVSGKINNIGTDVPSEFIELLRRRGIEGQEAVHNFLFPSLRDLPAPRKMKDLPTAARLVVNSIRDKKQILIWGDYDVDGTTGTALLINFFRALGVEVRWHIPNRLTEGYGLNCEWFFQDRKEGGLDDKFLLITVDCGISDYQHIESIKEMGGTVIVTDHHSLPEMACPDCLILNPSQPSCGFHGENLAGVGVAFYLAAGIRAEFMSRPDAKLTAKIILKPFLAFVALGTVADLVEITATNRILVRGGFEAISETTFPGIMQLLASCDILNGSVSSEDIGYLIGPRINAAGRLGESEIVVELLTEQTTKRAKKLAGKLSELNLKRRRISDSSLETALVSLTKELVQHNKCVLAKGDIHQGVAGIVASKLVDTFGLPSIVFAEIEQPDGEVIYTGSARSVDGVNIVEMLKYCSRWIVKFGGHEMAAGLTVSRENMTGFETEFISLSRKVIAERVKKPKKRYDSICSVDSLMSKEYLKCLQLMEPFGPGNSQPIFYDPQVQIIDSKTVGRNAEHLQVTIRRKYSNLKGIGFGLGNRISDIQRDPQRKMVYAPTVNRFRGTVSWQARVIDL